MGSKLDNYGRFNKRRLLHGDKCALICTKKLINEIGNIQVSSAGKIHRAEV